MKLEKLPKTLIKQFKMDLQEAFQQGGKEYFEDLDVEILPEKDIEESLNKPNSVVYGAIENKKLVGGCVVEIDEKTQHNHLDFLYVKNTEQNKGYGKAIWKKIEKIYSNTRIWETHTPYFDKRNIHFYVNICGFHIVEYYNKKHPNPHDNEETKDIEYFEDFFRFEKYNKVNL